MIPSCIMTNIQETSDYSMTAFYYTRFLPLGVFFFSLEVLCACSAFVLLPGVLVA